MKIAFFADSYRPQVNGLVVSVDSFVKQLRSGGHEVHIFAPASPGYRDSDRHVHRFDSLEFPQYKEYRLALPKTIRGSFDIVHVHSPFMMGICGIAFAKKNKTPVVGTFHTLFPEYGHYLIKSDRVMRFLKAPYKKISWAYLKWFYTKCDFVIAPSAHTKRILLKNGIRNVVVIPTGVELKARPKKSRKALRKKYGFGGGKIILHVGRITKEKNIKFIMSSLRRLLRDDVVLVITSDGPYKAELQKYIVKLGLAKRVIFTGYVSKQQLDDYYSMADLYVVASKTETQGIVLVEAALRGTPIVALDAPVISDFIKETRSGVVSPESKFAENVQKILRTGRKFKPVLDSYDIVKCTDKLLSLYGKACQTYQ